MNRTKPLPEFSVKPQSKIRNRKKKEKMDGYTNDLKPQHAPYKRDHHNYLLDDDEWDDEEDYRGYIADDY